MTLFVGLVSFPLVFAIMAARAEVGNGLLPTLVSTSTLCVSRHRSSPLSSTLSGTDDVRMFWDFGFPHPRLGWGMGEISSLGGSWLRLRPREFFKSWAWYGEGAGCWSSLRRHARLFCNGRDQFNMLVCCLAEIKTTRSLGLWPR